MISPVELEVAGALVVSPSPDSAPYFDAAGLATTFSLTPAARGLLDDVDSAAQRATLGVAIGSNVLAYHAGLQSIASVTVVAGQGLYATGASTWAAYNLTAGGRALGAVAGTADTIPYFSALNVASNAALTAFARTLLDDANQGQARTTLGLVIGTDVQAFSTNLTALSAKAAPAGALVGTSDAQALTNKTFDASVNTLTNLSVSMFAAGVVDADATFGANSDTRIPTQAAVRAFVLANAASNPKASVKAASTGNLTLSGTQTIDGVAVVAGDRVLAKDQTAPAQNGVWIVAAGAWTRATDLDDAVEFPRANVWVLAGGAVNGNTAWTCSNTAVTVGTTAITFVQSAAQTTYVAGAGLGVTGNVISITDPELLALASLTSAADRLPYFTGAGTAGTTPLTAFMRSLLDDPDAATARVTLGVLQGIFGAPSTVGPGTAADLGAQTARHLVIGGSQAGITTFGSTAPTSDPFFFIRWSTPHTLIPSANLIVPGGVTFQVAVGDCCVVVYEGGGVWRVVWWYNSRETSGGRALCAVTGTAGTFPYFSAGDVASSAVLTAAGRALLDDADAAAQRITLGVAPTEINHIGTIADDGVAVVPLNTTGAMVMLVPDNAGPAARALLWARTVATLGIQSLASAGVTVGLYTTALTGTTGVDGQVNVGVSGGNLYVENRSGAARNYRLFIFRFDS